jgi:hypothetical protein
MLCGDGLLVDEKVKDSFRSGRDSLKIEIDNFRTGVFYATAMDWIHFFIDPTIFRAGIGAE